MRLQDKFKKVFIFPLICGILLSILLTVFILLIYSRRFSDSNLIDRLQKVELGKSNPIIYTANNLIFKKFQKTIYALQLIRKYYKFYADSVIKGYLKFNTTLIDKHVTNSLKINENYKEFIEELELSGENNSTYLDNAFWHYDNKVTNYTKLSDNFKQQMTVLTHMIPSLRAIYETSKNNLANRFDLIYFANKKSNLFFAYPIYNKNKDFFKIYQKVDNAPSCKTPSGIQPDYYYFQCRDWWQQVVESTINPQQHDIIITHPYKFLGIHKYGITVCIKFDDPFAKLYDTDSSNWLTSVCIDTEINDLISVFDHFNKELAGYFYVLRVNSDIPIYYPMILQNDYFSNIARFEFDIGTPYFVEELADFSDNTKPKLIQKYDEATLDLSYGQTLASAYEGNYQKNGLASNYTIYPVKLFTNEYTLNKPWHIITIVYVYQPSTLKSSLQRFEEDLYPRLGIQIFLFFIMGAILVLIAWYLIISIASNIVKPIKNLKYLIQGMNVNTDNNENPDANPDTYNNKNNNNKSKHSKVSPNTFKKNLHDESLSDLYDINDESKINDNLISEEIEYDEETLEMRSAEMDKLFNILLKLKNVLSFTTNSKTAYDRNALVNYVNAKYTFNEVSNLKGKNVCDSNVGNLSIRCQKYDKAIFHLIESLPEIKKNLVNTKINRDSLEINLQEFLVDIQNNLHTNIVKKNSRIYKNNKNSINLKIRSSNTTGVEELIGSNLMNNFNNLETIFENNTDNKFKENYSPDLMNKNCNHNFNSENNNNNNSTRNENKKKDPNQMIIIESRYPKLIYSYKRLFKSFRKFFKKITKDEERNEINQKLIEELIQMDIYVIKERHSLEAYENFLMDYIKESTSIGDNRRTAEAILEYLEFLIIYKLKADNDLGVYFDFNINKISENLTNYNSDKNNNNGLTQIQQNKLEVLEQIGKYFKHFDVIYDLLRQSCSSEYFKNFLDMLRTNRQENLEIIETPFLVLYQKSNYLKGKVAKICGHYDKSLEFFHRSRETLIICDASLIKKSIKQIVKIMEYLKIEVEKELLIENEKNLNLSDIKESGNNLSTQISHGNKNSANYILNNEKKVKDKLDDLKDKSREIENYITNNLEQLENFDYRPKDLIILIDVSQSMVSDGKKIERALRSANNFFEMYVSNDDRFGLFIYTNSINPIISLTEKNYNTYIYVKKLIDGMLQDSQFGLSNENFNNTGSNKNSHSCKAISLAYEYLSKKNPNPKLREKWIVLFTDSFTNENNSYKDLKVFSDLKHIRETTKEQINVIVVGINMEKDEANRLRENLINLSKKSDFVDFDNINHFSNILKTHGGIKIETEYPNEKYESDKIKRY